MSGKLHLQPPRRRFGFDAMDLANSSRSVNNDYLTWLGGEAPFERWAMANGATSNGWIGRPTHLPEEKTLTFWTASRAIDFLETRDPTVPFFLNVSFMDPHPPFTPPAFFFDRYDRMDLPEPVIGDWVPPFPGPRRGLDPELSDDVERWSRRLNLDPGPMHHCRAGYYGLVNHVDMQLNRLFQYMRDRGLLNDTFIMFVSDHGEMLGDHHLFAKTWPYEASVRVPFLARAPQFHGVPEAGSGRGAGGSSGRDADAAGCGRAATSLNRSPVAACCRGCAGNARVARRAAWRARGPVPGSRRQPLDRERAAQVHLVQPDRRRALVRRGRRPQRGARPGPRGRSWPRGEADSPRNSPTAPKGSAATVHSSSVSRTDDSCRPGDSDGRQIVDQGFKAIARRTGGPRDRLQALEQGGFRHVRP